MTLTDEELMIRIQQGDRSAYETLYWRWLRPLYSFLIKRTGSAQRAEDALQQTWLRVYRYRDSYDSTYAVKTWLFTIASRINRDHQPLVLDSLEERAAQGATLPVSARVHSRAEHQLHWREVMTALHTLSSVDRTILLLASEGFTAPEIGQAVELSSKTVRNRLSRARRQLQACLHD